MQDPHQEQWRDIAGFPTYEVSDLGQVRNKKTHRILQKSYLNDYEMVKIYNDQHRFKNVRVSRLVAKAFVPNPDPLTKTQVDHIGGSDTKCDNRACNLRWVTPKENMAYFWTKSKKPEKVAVRVSDGVNEQIYPSIYAAARDFGYANSTMWSYLLTSGRFGNGMYSIERVECPTA